MATNEIVVTQEDRVAAAVMYLFVQSKTKLPHSEQLQTLTEEQIRRGRFDQDEAVQAFAAHRIAAEQRGYERAREQAAGMAETKANQAADIALEGGDRARSNESMEAMATRIATAIRSMKDEGR